MTFQYRKDGELSYCRAPNRKPSLLFQIAQRLAGIDLVHQMSTEPSVFGLGSSISLGLAVFAEFFCALALILGLGSRLVLIPLIVTMAVAAFVIHGADPFGKKELALVYLCAYIGLFLMGSGRYSVDTVIAKKWRS